MRHSAALALIALVFLLSSCDDDTRGLLITGDGSVLANTAVNYRNRVTAHIVSELDGQLGAHWLAAAAIGELPEYDEDFNRGYPDNWFWGKATVQVELAGDGQQELPQTIESITDGVRDYLRRRVDRPKRNLAITVTSHVDAARFADLARAARPAGAAPAPVAAPAAVAAPAPGSAHAPSTAATPGSAPAPRAAGTHSYTLQKGDTLAVISSVFYGTADRWRLILDANPGLDSANLILGTVITIPPAPAP